MDNQLEKGDFNQMDIDSDPNAFQRIGAELKTTIFRMVSLITKEQEISLYIALVIPIIEFLQVMSYCFYNQDHDVWRFHNVSNVFHQFFEHLRLAPYFQDTSMAVYSLVLYIIIGFGVISVLGLVYTYYMASRRKPIFSWPVIANKFILGISANVMFLPQFDYFVSILNCVENENGQSIFVYFNDTRCWEKIHLVDTIFAVCTAVLFLVVILVTTLIFFEPRPSSNNPNARINARALLLFNIHKIILVLLFTFLPYKDYQTTLMAYLLVASTIVFAKFQFQNPFYNEIISKAWSTMAAINLWTVIMFIFAKIMVNTNFKEAIFIWLIGIPLVFIVNISNVDKRMSFFLINTDKFQSGHEIIYHIQYLEKLLSIQNTNKSASLMLDGYLEIHKQDCFNEQCPCRNKNKVLNNNRITRNLLNSDENLSEKEAVIIYLIYQLYVQGIKSFPNHTFLTIAYSFFLHNKMSSKQQALQILMDAEQRSLAIDTEFIIFRYKKLIEDEIAESQQEELVDNGLDIGSESSFQNHMRMCQANIEKSALLHMEFWSQLSEDQPDLAKLEEIGSKISLSVKQVEDQWNKLFKINPNNAKAIRLYGKFLIDVTHNKERGEELLNRANNLANVNHGKKNINFVSANKDLEDEASPTIIISGEQEKFGSITNINIAAASLFGFSKTELLGRKLTTLMPSIYAKYHDIFLERYLQTNESTILNKNKERFVFGKTKSTYMFPFHYNVKAIPSILQGVQFVAILRIERRLRNIAYVITHEDGTIDSISSSCINLLKIDKTAIQRKAKIQDYVYNIIADRHALFDDKANGVKASTHVTFHYPPDSEYLEENEQESVELLCSFYEISFLNGKENSGFQFKFERPVDKLATHRHHNISNSAKISNFQFRIDKQRPIVTGEYVSDNLMRQETPEMHEVLGTINSPSQNTEGGIHFGNSGNVISPKREDDHYATTKIEYGIGVKTYRLKNRQITDIDDEKSNDDDEENETENNILQGKRKSEVGSMGLGLTSNASEENVEDESSIADFGNAAKSRKLVAAVINDKTSPTNVRRLNGVIHLLGVVFIGFSIWNYVNLVDQLDGLSKGVLNIEQSREMVADLMVALSNLRDLYLTQRNLFDSSGQAALLSSLQSSLDAAIKKKEFLEKDKSSLSAAHRRMLDDPVIPLKNIGGDTTLRGLIQATEDIVTRGYYLVQNPSLISASNNADYYFVTMNLMGDYWMSLTESSHYYVDEFMHKTDKSGGFSISLALIIAAIVFALLIIIPIILVINKSQDQVLRLFLDIPDKTVKSLYSKCENFVSNLQIGEEEEMESEFDNDETEREGEDQETQGWLTRRRRKKFKNSRKSSWGFFIGYIILAVLVISPLIYSQAASSTVLNNIATVAIEYNATSYIELFLGESMNVQRQLFIDNTSTVLGYPVYFSAVGLLDIDRDLVSYVLSNNSVNIQSHTSEYNRLFYQIFYSNPCPYLTATVPESDCNNFANKTAPKGMSLLLVRHFESMTILFNYYTAVINNQPWPSTAFIGSSYRAGIDSDSVKNDLLNIMRTARALEIIKTQEIYVKASFRLLLTNFRESLNDNFDNFKTVKLLTFILSIVLMMLVYIFIWVPLMARLNNKIWKTKSMLIMIPINVIIKIKTIRAFLRSIINENQLHNFSS